VTPKGYREKGQGSSSDTAVRMLDQWLGAKHHSCRVTGTRGKMNTIAVLQQKQILKAQNLLLGRKRGPLPTISYRAFSLFRSPALQLSSSPLLEAIRPEGPDRALIKSLQYCCYLLVEIIPWMQWNGAVPAQWWAHGSVEGRSQPIEQDSVESQIGHEN
jgi:hypothetical protein